MAVVGVNEEGYREVLPVEPAGGERKKAWRNMLKGLIERGHRVRLAISNNYPSIRHAVMAEPAEGRWQQRMVHFERNLLARVPQSERKVVAEDLKEVFSVKQRSTTEYLGPGVC